MLQHKNIGHSTDVHLKQLELAKPKGIPRN